MVPFYLNVFEPGGAGAERRLAAETCMPPKGLENAKEYAHRKERRRFSPAAKVGDPSLNMMKLQTKYHGEVEIEDAAIWHFEGGIPGFPDEKSFVLLPLLDDGIYMVLQSTASPYVAFVVTSPFLFFRDYEFNIDDATLEQLSIEKEEDVRVYAILTVRDPFSETTANLQAPLIMNEKNHKAKQLILNDRHYHTRHPLFADGPDKEKG